jgi:hypothetical protein
MGQIKDAMTFGQNATRQMTLGQKSQLCTGVL